MIHEPTSISSGLFTECHNLTEVVVVDNDEFYPLTRIDPTAFPGSGSYVFHLPDTITTLDRALERGSAKFFVTPGSTTDATVRATGYTYFYYEGYPDFKLWTYQGDGDLWLLEYTGSGGAVTIPSFVNVIESYGFSDTYRIDKVIIPASVKTIRNGFLQNSYSLREVVIEPGSNLTELPTHFISGCNDITLYIPDNIQYCPDPINYYMYNDMLIVANCNAPVIESVKGNSRWGDENEKRSGARYRLIHDLVHHDGQAPTCDADGWAPYDTCKNCDYTTYTAIPALGHDWGAAAYEWTADHTKLTATRVCQNDNAHIETETVDVTAEIILAPTCTEMGQTTYTSAAFENQAFTAQTVTLTDIPALGHNWVHGPSTAAADGRDGVRGGIFCSVCRAVQEADRAVSAQKVLKLPAMAKQIEAEAFTGISAQQVVIPAGTLSLGERAFADCGSLLIAVIPASVSEIADDAFAGTDIAVICTADSYAAAWCDGHNIPHNP